jgi:hypothetical protein
VAQPAREGRDEVNVTAARLLEDGRTVVLTVPDLAPAMQMELKYNLETREHQPVRGPLWLSVNHVPASR